MSTATAGDALLRGKESRITARLPRASPIPPSTSTCAIDDAGTVEVSRERSDRRKRRRQLRRHDRRRLQGLLHLRRTPHRRRRGHTPAPPSTCGPKKGEEEPHPLTLISKADPGSPAGAGDTAACNPAHAEPLRTIERGTAKEKVPWTNKCGVLPFSAYPYSFANGGIGGNGISDYRHRLQNRRHLLLLPRAARRRPRRPRQAEPLRLPRRRPPLRHHLQPRKPLHTSGFGTDIRVATSAAPARSPASRSPPRHPHGLPHRLPAHLLRQRRPPGDVLLHPRHRIPRLRLLQPRRPPRHRRRRSLPGRPLPHRRRPHLLLHHRSPRPHRHQPGRGRL